jgi:hypothetical protein
MFPIALLVRDCQAEEVLSAQEGEDFRKTQQSIERKDTKWRLQALVNLLKGERRRAEGPRPHSGADELEVQRRDICAQHASQAQR